MAVHRAHADHVYYHPDTGERLAATGPLQIVFCDRGTPSKDPHQCTVYQAIKDELIARGMRAEAVRFVHEARKPSEVAALRAQCNGGEVSVLIGSTKKLGRDGTCRPGCGRCIMSTFRGGRATWSSVRAGPAGSHRAAHFEHVGTLSIASVVSILKVAVVVPPFEPRLQQIYADSSRETVEHQQQQAKHRLRPLSVHYCRWVAAPFTSRRIGRPQARARRALHDHARAFIPKQVLPVN